MPGMPARRGGAAEILAMPCSRWLRVEVARRSASKCAAAWLLMLPRKMKRHEARATRGIRHRIEISSISSWLITGGAAKAYFQHLISHEDGHRRCATLPFIRAMRYEHGRAIEDSSAALSSARRRRCTGRAERC